MPDTDIMILKSKHYCQYTYCYLTIKLPCITDKFPRYGILYRILLQCTGYVLDDLAVFHLRYLCVWYGVNQIFTGDISALPIAPTALLSVVSPIGGRSYASTCCYWYWAFNIKEKFLQWASLLLLFTLKIIRLTIFTTSERFWGNTQVSFGRFS